MIRGRPLRLRFWHSRLYLKVGLYHPGFVRAGGGWVQSGGYYALGEEGQIVSDTFKSRAYVQDGNIMCRFVAASLLLALTLGCVHVLLAYVFLSAGLTMKTQTATMGPFVGFAFVF